MMWNSESFHMDRRSRLRLNDRTLKLPQVENLREFLKSRVRGGGGRMCPYDFLL